MDCRFGLPPLVAYAKETLKLDKTIYEISQILSVSAFDKAPINQILKERNIRKNKIIDRNQLIIFDL